MPTSKHAMRWLAALTVAFGLHAEPTQARTLDVEVEFQHIGGMLATAEFDAWMASPDLVIEAVYHPLRLIEGKTARRIQTMPFGSRLEPNLRTITLRGASIERAGRTLRFRLEEQEAYRLFSVDMSVPILDGIGRPQPALRMAILHEPAAQGANQAALAASFDAFDLGGRLRYRWSDAPADWKRKEPLCGGDVREAGPDRYRFRERHPHLGLFRALHSGVDSSPPVNPPPGWKSFQMREPYPPPLDGWRVSRNHLIRLDIPGGRVDRLSIYAEQVRTGFCRRTRSYDALLSGDQFVRIERSVDEYDCAGSSAPNQTARAEWLADGNLAYYMQSLGANPAVYDAFSLGQPAACGTLAPAPGSAEVEALKAEVMRLREAFLGLQRGPGSIIKR